MAEAFVGEIRAFPFTYAPEDWLPCDGRTLAVSDYQELFAVIGTTYGGASPVNFQLPKLNGAAPMGSGTGTGLTSRQVGQSVGSAGVTLSIPQMPAHQHNVTSRNSGQVSDLTNMPTAGAALSRTYNQLDFSNATINPWTVSTGLSAMTIAPAGGGGAHENRQPALVMTLCICTTGYFPNKP